MNEPAPRRHLGYAEYLAAEAASETKHEFLDGEVFAMAGGTPQHAALAAAVIQLLGSALAGKPCRVFSSDLRVRIRATGLTTYPDVSVVCGKLETDVEDANAITNPVVVVEVLSDSTEAYDRGGKARHYRRIPSLAEYVLVAHGEPGVEVHRKNEHGRWEIFEFRAGEQVELVSVGASFAVDAIYVDPLAS